MDRPYDYEKNNKAYERMTVQRLYTQQTKLETNHT